MKRKEFVRLAAAVALFAFVVGAASVAVLRPDGARAQDSDTITATELAVVDGAGNLRQLLSTNEGDGSPSIGMYSKEGTTRAVYSLSAAGEPSMILDNSAGEMRMIFAVMDEVGPGALLKDKAGKTVWRAPSN